ASVHGASVLRLRARATRGRERGRDGESRVSVPPPRCAGRRERRVFGRRCSGVSGELVARAGSRDFAGKGNARLAPRSGSERTLALGAQHGSRAGSFLPGVHHARGSALRGPLRGGAHRGGAMRARASALLLSIAASLGTACWGENPFHDAENETPPCVPAFSPGQRLTVGLDSVYDASSDYFYDGSFASSGWNAMGGCADEDGLGVE